MNKGCGSAALAGPGGGCYGRRHDDESLRMILYGIPTCDTCRKAMKEIAAAGRPVTFRDVRSEPLDTADISRFLAALGDGLVNRASTTWRGLDDTARAAGPAALLAAHPTLMKRPVIDVDGALILGWTDAVRARVLK